jgi:hypothetical protein
MQKCTVCGKPAEEVPTENICQCRCPECGEKCFDDVTLADHGKCYDCHKEELLSSSDPHVLVINITDQEKTFTDQLHRIIADINEGYTSGYGWSIGELEPEEK